MKKNRIKSFIAKLLIISIIFSNVFTNESLAMASKVSREFIHNITEQNKLAISKQVNKQKTQIIVKYKETNESDIKSTDNIAGSNKDNQNDKEKVKEKIKNELKLAKLETKKNYKNDTIEILEIDESDNIDDVIQALNEEPSVEYAQSNYKLSIQEVITDDQYIQQWAIYDGEEPETDFGINVTEIWKMQEGLETTSVIGVLDTGIDINHPDLAANIFTNTYEIPDNGIDDDGNGYIDDINGWDFANADASVYDNVSDDRHGTHVAGILSADDNGVGIIGVAKDSIILPLKFINGTHGYTSDAIEAIEYAKKMGVNIINGSFGSTEYNPALKEVMADSEILFVVPAGNNGQDVTVQPIYPACFDLDNVISVTAYDMNGNLGTFANYGESIDVAAPGVDILSTVPNNRYEVLSGTSMAVPYISGIAALIKNSYADMTASDIISRIKDNVVIIDSMQGKTSTGGRVDAWLAFNGTQEIIDIDGDSETDEEENDEEEASSDVILSIMAASVTPELMEQIHYGENGVNAAIGNYSTKVVDMTMESPGFTLNISRTYNSKDDKQGFMGRGWTFGFEGSFTQDNTNTDMYIAKMPNGSSHIFIKNADGTFTANDFRGTMTTATDNTHILTTADKYTYCYDVSGWLIWMMDPSGNKVIIGVDNSTGKVLSITDQVGRVFTVTYNAENKISKITDPMGREITYGYTNGLLTVVTDPTGRTQKYEYDSYSYMTITKNHNSAVIEMITYDHTSSNEIHQVSSYTDVYGNVLNYTYSTGITSITDVNGRTLVKNYDNQFYITSSQDPEGRVTTVEYFKDANGINVYGEEKTITDRNGNVTSYERDANGNITKIIYPDDSYCLYEYDDKNNNTMEQDQEGNRTYYIYDVDKVKLLKEVKPLNGTDVYDEQGDQTNFVITTYSYYSDAEAAAMGCQAKKLLKSVTDTQGNTVSYTYDNYGNIKTTTDAMGYITTNIYNIIGWLISTKTPSGYETTFTYDLEGKVVKKVGNEGDTTRYVYDALGRKIQEVSPNQYNTSADGLNNSIPADTYAELTGTIYTYNEKNQLVSKRDSEGNSYHFTYDIYGNIETETQPNGAVYKYAYDLMNRVIRTSIKEDETEGFIILEDKSYQINADCTTSKVIKKYLNKEMVTADTTYTYDYAGSLITQQNPDGTTKSIGYNNNGLMSTSTDTNGATTYYQYNALGHLVGKWAPIELDKYSYSGTKYDKIGNIIETYTGKDLVSAYVIPSSDRLITTNMTYDGNGHPLSRMNSSGSKALFEYDIEGNIKKTITYVDESETEITDFESNGYGKVTKKTSYIKAGDLSDYDIYNENMIALITTYEYDLNGNITKTTDVDGQETTYTYDSMNRQLSVSTIALDENQQYVTITQSKQYDLMGNLTEETDAMGYTTSYSYNLRGQLAKVTKTTIEDGVTTNYITAYAYDNAGRKIIEVSPNAYLEGVDLSNMDRTEYTYDKMDRLTVKSDIYKIVGTGEWHIVTNSYTYDTQGNKITTADGMGYVTYYTYDMAGRMLTMIDPEAKEDNLPFTIKYTYDGVGRKRTETNALGMVTAYYYDDASNITKVTVKGSATEAERTLSTSSYNLVGNVLSTTDANGNIISFCYNSMNKVKKVVYPSSYGMQCYFEYFQYDESGNITKQQDSMGKIQLNTYDMQDRRLTHTTQDKAGVDVITTSSAYDLNGNVRFTKDGNGNIVEKSYDGLNRLVSERINVTAVDGTVKNHITSYGYDKNSNLLTVTDYLGNTSTSKYDSLNRLIEQRDAYGQIVTRMEYNDNHVQTKAYDGKGSFTSFEYDKSNRVTVTTDPEGNIARNVYDVIGNIISSVDGRGFVTNYSFNSFGRLTCVENAKGEATTYTYDLMGNMLTQTDGNGNAITMEYNTRNIPVKRMYPGAVVVSNGTATYDYSKIETMTYYADGKLRDKTDRNGNTTVYLYDVFGRLLSTKCGEDAVNYTYDKNSNTLTMEDSTGITVRGYDELNRVKTKSVPIAGMTSFRYDITMGLEAGQVSEQSIDGKGNEVEKIYDRLGRLYKVISDGMTTIYAYDSNGNKETTTYSVGYMETYTYGLNNKLLALTTKKTDGTIIKSYNYTYDGAGNQISKTELDGTTLYAYDSLNRLERITEPDGKTTTYLYDAAGNRIQETVTIVLDIISDTEYTYDEQNSLIQTVKNDNLGTKETSRYTYDANGNNTYVWKDYTTSASGGLVPIFGFFILEQTSPAENSAALYVTSYEYDRFNQMVRASVGEDVSEFTYNGEGFRVKSTVNGETTIHVYEHDKVVLELDGNGVQVAKNIYGDGRLISRKNGTETAYYLFNGHGDVTGLINASGTVIATYQYDAFGNITDETGSMDNPYRYAGYQYDESTGLYYLNARMYDPSIARFMQMDTYLGSSNDPLSLNLYTYCYNNPIRYWDPTGHIVTQWDKDNLSIVKQIRLNTQTYLYDKAKAAGDTAGMAAAHEKAEAIRNTVRTSNEVASTHTDGYTYVVNSNQTKASIYYDDACAVSSSGYKAPETISKNEWQQTVNVNENNLPEFRERKEGYSQDDQLNSHDPKPHKGTDDVDSSRYIPTEPSAGKSYWEMYLDCSDSGNNVIWGVDVVYQYERYVMECNDNGEYFVDKDIFVNAMGPIWEETDKNKTWDQRVGELVYGVFITVVVLGAAFEGALIAEGIAVFGFKNSAAMYQGGTLRANLTNYYNPIKLTANDIQFSDKFSKPAYTNQIAERGWTKQSIANTINNPIKTGTSVNKYTGNGVTAYYIDDVHYVAVDNVTGKVIQVADINKVNWVFDLTK